MTSKEYFDAKLKKLPLLELREEVREAFDARRVKRLHITGVCGTAMGPLAGLLREAGYMVTGSDKGCYPPMDKMIHDLGITFFEGLAPEHIADADVVVMANMFAPDNVEARAAQSQKKPMASLPEILYQFFLAQKKPIVVAGTHGKTTTTGLIAHLFSSAGLEPGYLIGGVPQAGTNNYRIGTGDYFVIEGDEYDTAYFDKRPKFLHYAPYIGIITSVEFDHADIYTDFEDYKTAFRYFAELVHPEGTLFVAGDSPVAIELSKNAKATVISYDVGVENTRDAILFGKIGGTTKTGTTMTIFYKGEIRGEIEIPMFGRYNAMNALVAYGTGLIALVPHEKIADGIKTFSGMKRRQEVIVENDNYSLIEDFAHHPTAVVETLAGIRDHFSARRIVVCFEPRSNTSRRKIFESEYGKAFVSADVILLSLPKLKEGESSDELVDLDHLVGLIEKTGKVAIGTHSAEELFPKLTSLLKSGDVVVVMSNGSFDGLTEKIKNHILSL